ncbi:hypothetical protein [Dokdonia sp.]|uniref:hypothetical protein n=1 Tax=Dokdonia sp. TaxID=2024995 RepID=UPI0032672FBA
MAIEFISEQHKNITYTEEANSLIKKYVLENPNAIVNFKLNDLKKKNGLELFEFIGNESDARNQISDYETIESILKYKSLKGLFINEHTKPKVDMSNFPNLRLLSCDWNLKILNISTLKKLQQFNLFQYKPKSKNLMELSTLSSLKYLKLGSGNYESLKGLNKLKNLRELRIYSNRSVKTDDTIILESVEALYISSCKSYDHDFYKSFPNLKILHLESSNDLESLKPILDNLINLKEINICGIKVLEEDNTYWKDYKNITTLNFFNRKHQKLKTKDFENYPYKQDGQWKGIPRTIIE